MREKREEVRTMGNVTKDPGYQSRRLPATVEAAPETAWIRSEPESHYFYFILIN
jgi:hypothetical protein